MPSQTYTNSVTLTDATEFNNFDTAAYSALTAVAGTNTITATGPANYSLSYRLPFSFIPAATNTGATTLNISGAGAKNVFSGGAACVGGELIINVPVLVIYDGTQYNIIGFQRSDAYIYVRDEKASSTVGGTFTSGAWRTRDLNTEVNDAGGFASVGSNQVTLAAGTYRFRARAPALYVDRHQIRLANVTDSTYYYGSSAYSDASGSGRTTDSVVSGRFTIASAKVFEVQHQCLTTKTTDGFGTYAGFGNVEVYSEVEFWREK